MYAEFSFTKSSPIDLSHLANYFNSPIGGNYHSNFEIDTPSPSSSPNEKTSTMPYRVYRLHSHCHNPFCSKQCLKFWNSQRLMTVME